MNFKQAAQPHVTNKLNQAHKFFASKDDEKGFMALEDAHVTGQHSTYYHTLVHYKMLMYGLKSGDLKEVPGQVFRLIGAITKTAVGLVPEGNTGGTNVSPFKLMPISPENTAILEKINHARSQS
ncbi:DUF3703 domain-containing protein [Alteromonas mediterranea]|mgnify:FL=1|jgi:hypothetical protein|uniref:DUF3703 domain-containing protein n=1 Tax=Alteromonas mediterranea TaxID=314275 RepID=A0AAC8XLF3_9ALTE|nr:DUF3703 domain-containing protein [Alteromonas mediterranea]AGP91908.1 hypothetical protein I634_00790 [Alteromonas mediterranea U8]AFV86451.1 hypothetical protein amad1_14775 [Alteromonas mediterranea DE1]AGP86580.1 hypothetical protein I607_13975 [Alteromonas mediterranea U4]AGP90742.1 hypothetical protein I876_14475 [Alteromonas mediterranea U7]AGP98463.1 hypothetical protein I635_14750 [Alteromonas mediterranea UM7]|tara:strand:- start:2911 stop:3282 length:372 start_codon:yes stop_codon:yes gene_type:complete